MGLILGYRVIWNLALTFILLFFHIALVELLNLNGLLTFLPIFPLRLYQSFDIITLRWSCEAKTVRCICLYHLLYIVIIIFLRLSCKRPKLLFFRDWESLIVIKTIEVIEHTLNWLLYLSEGWLWDRDCLSHWTWFNYRHFWNISLLNTWLVHSCLKHFPCILIFLWKLCESFFLNWNLWLRNHLLLWCVGFFWFRKNSIVLLII